jgi:hypothetical protein
VLRTDAGEVIYLEGLSAWPSGLAGRRVEALGLLTSKKLIADPAVDETGAISQGAPGLQTVLESPRWSVAD